MNCEKKLNIFLQRVTEALDFLGTPNHYPPTAFKFSIAAERQAGALAFIFAFVSSTNEKRGLCTGIKNSIKTLIDVLASKHIVDAIQGV